MVSLKGMVDYLSTGIMPLPFPSVRVKDLDGTRVRVNQERRLSCGVMDSHTLTSHSHGLRSIKKYLRNLLGSRLGAKFFLTLGDPGVGAKKFTNP